MEAFAPFILVGWVLAIGVPVTLVMLAFSAYYRIKGIERACWAIVSQLRATRMEKLPDVDPEATKRAHHLAESSGHVRQSMFGR